MIAVVRLTPDGALDANFGNQGIVLTDFNAGSDDSGSSLIIQPDGKIVVVGVSGLEFGVARYIANTSPTTQSDQAVVGQGSAGNVLQVLANDNDSDGDRLSIVEVSPTARGATA